MGLNVGKYQDDSRCSSNFQIKIFDGKQGRKISSIVETSPNIITVQCHEFCMVVRLKSLCLLSDPNNFVCISYIYIPVLFEVDKILFTPKSSMGNKVTRYL